MTTSRNGTAATWLTATGLAVGASAMSLGATASTAAAAPLSGGCPLGSSLVATGVCAITLTSSANVAVPAGVSSLQILAVGGGGGGGGGTTYGAGGGGGGGAVRVCSVSLVDLTRTLDVVVGAGGSGGANGADHLYDAYAGGEFGDPGAAGGSTKVVDERTLCAASGGGGGQPGYNYLTSSLPTTPKYGGGGDSGSGKSGGSAAGLAASNTADNCTFSNWQYNLTASGGAGDRQAGAAASGGTSGAGGNGSIPTTGLFSSNKQAYGGGGGGGAGYDCKTYASAAIGGTGGGGNGGIPGSQPAFRTGSTVTPHHLIPHPLPEAAAPTPGQANLGGGGGGGTGQYFAGNPNLYGIAGANGGSGVVEIRFAKPAATIASAVYFATASSALTGADKAALTSYAKLVVAQGRTKVNVQGFCDPRGSASANQALSEARAASTASFLRQLFASDHASVTVTAVGRGVKRTYSNYSLDRVATLTSPLPPQIAD